MKSKLFNILTILSVVGLLASACNAAQSGANAQPTAVPPVVTSNETIAEGRIVPNDSRDLAFFTNGQVEEVFVKKGDQVASGDVIARLGDSERIQAQIVGAENELTAALRALNDLKKPETLEVARAQFLRAISSANKAVKDAQYNLDNFTVPTDQEKLTPMEGVIAMKQVLDEARAAFEPYKYLSSGDSTRKALKDKLDNAQSDYNAAVRRLELETILKQAQANLEKATADYQTLASGPNPDDLTAAEARVKAAEASLVSVKATLKDMDLVATIGGTVVKQDLIIGQQIVAAVPVVSIADFSKLYAETDDLTEIEVVDVSVGQKVTVVADALPGVEMTGVVESISQIYEEKRGDVTYTVKILVDNPDPRLRWGMTVVITFKK